MIKAAKKITGRFSLKAVARSRFLAASLPLGLLLSLAGCASTAGSPPGGKDHIPAAGGIEQPAGPTQPAVPSGFRPPPPSAATKAQKEQYQKGQNLLKNRDYKGAALVFQRILDGNLEAPLAPNARYWLGECYYAQGRYEEALREFNRCYHDYPQTLKASDALLKRAYCYNMLNRGQEAMRDLDLLLRNYPRSSAAGLVRSGRVRFRQPG